MEKLIICYDTFETIVTNNKLKFYYVTQNVGYLAFAINDSYIFSCNIVETSEITAFENDLISSGAETQSGHDAIALLLNAIGKAKPVSLTSDGRLFVAVSAPEGSKSNFVTFNFCDKTTWYYNAIRVVDEIASCIDSPTYTQYQLAHTYIIDSYHGKIFHEDFVKDSNGNSLRVSVKVNNTSKTEQDPHYGSGGDYTINYVTGVITFLSALIVTDEVKVTYHYATDSYFSVKPSSNKVLRIKSVECQFSEDIELTDTMEYSGWGYVDVFAPQYVNNPYPSGTLIPLTDPERFKSMVEIMSDANGNYPELPALGGSGWRGMTKKVYTFPWNYTATTKIIGEYGMEIRVRLQHDTPLIGTFCTVTFYTSITDL